MRRRSSPTPVAATRASRESCSIRAGCFRAQGSESRFPGLGLGAIRVLVFRRQFVLILATSTLAVRRSGDRTMSWTLTEARVLRWMIPWMRRTRRKTGQSLSYICFQAGDTRSGRRGHGHPQTPSIDTKQAEGGSSPRNILLIRQWIARLRFLWPAEMDLKVHVCHYKSLVALPGSFDIPVKCMRRYSLSKSIHER